MVCCKEVSLVVKSTPFQAKIQGLNHISLSQCIITKKLWFDKGKEEKMKSLRGVTVFT